MFLCLCVWVCVYVYADVRMPKDIDADSDPLEVHPKHEAIYDAQVPSWAECKDPQSLHVELQLAARWWIDFLIVLEYDQRNSMRVRVQLKDLRDQVRRASKRYARSLPQMSQKMPSSEIFSFRVESQ